MKLPHLRRILIIVCLLIVLPGLLREASADTDYVTIVSFTATPGAGQILVEWETVSEINVMFYCVQRSQQEAGGFSRIAACVLAKGDISVATYQVTDTAVVAGARYFYKLEVLNLGGTAEYYGPISAVLEAPAGRTWHVATIGSDTTGDGSEAQPFATIQHGIDAAENGDTVLVHSGVYTENINFNGKNITVGSLFITTGDEDTILQTVIDGNRSGRVVTFVNGETSNATLSGFTITNGYAQGASEPASYGGGIYCHYADPTLTHLRVTGNEADDEGGGLHLRDSAPTIRDVMVTNNHANGGGGGIRYTGGSVSLENAVVTHNSARTGGSGLFFYHADGAIKNALIAENFGGGPGGGLVFDGCSPTFTNVTVVGNRTTGHGGGLNVSYMSHPTLVNSIVWGNTPEQIYFDTNWLGEAISIEYSDVEGGEAGIVTNGQGPVYWGEGNLQVSPRFVHAGLGNYRLADDSPALSAGRAEGAPSTDIEGRPRPNPVGSNPDMGAYENPHASTLSLKSTYLPLIHRALPSVAQRPFWADSYQIAHSQCTFLHWFVTNVQAVYLDGMPVAGQGSFPVCPSATTQYILRIVYPDGLTIEYVVTIVVEGEASWIGVDAQGNFYRGNPDAAVKLEEFMDFQCPFCARHALQTGPLIKEAYIDTGQVLQVFRNFPLDFHPNALPAAKAAYCAGRQSPALFWTMYDWLFENQETWSAASDAPNRFRAAAVSAGATGSLYDACLASPATEAHIWQDIAEGAARGVKGIPAFYINSCAVLGAVPYEVFQATIQKAQQGQCTGESTPPPPILTPVSTMPPPPTQMPAPTAVLELTLAPAATLAPTATPPAHSATEKLERTERK